MAATDRNNPSLDRASDPPPLAEADHIRPAEFSSKSDVVIRFDDIWKQYRLGTINHGTLANDLQSWWARVRRQEDPNLRFDKVAPLAHCAASSQQCESDRFWALKEISFDVCQGDVFGIIGRNGAGKSTLLKILSRVTSPTRGMIRVKGHIASLLEVGTGFHPELTGRENVFLNGAILGMNKLGIRKRFDEIVAFAGIDKFIDTPVKRYSSGMYVRLAFAVAAHLDPDILVIDEVLAVGDTVFQKKCIDKILEINAQGRTVLFVSHNLSLVGSTCSKGVVLKDGKIAYLGDVRAAIDHYIEEGTVEGKIVDLETVPRQYGQQELLFDKLTFVNYPIGFNDKIILEITLKSKVLGREFKEIDFGIAIGDKERKRLIHISNRFLNVELQHEADLSHYYFEIDNILKPGIYYLTLFVRSCEVVQDWLTDVVRFTVEDGNPYGFYDTNQINGVILPKFDVYKE